MLSWKDHLRGLVDTQRFTTQHALVVALGSAGFDVHQGSVSRELSRLGVSKRNGVYVLPDESLGARVHGVTVTAAGCLVVLRTEPAFAPVLGQAIDAAALPGVLGTIAGDDTVFVATSGADSSVSVGALFDFPLEISA